MKNSQYIIVTALILLLGFTSQASAHKKKHKHRDHHNNHSYQLGFTGHYYTPSRKHKRHVSRVTKPYRYYAPRYGHTVKRYNHDHRRGCKHRSHYDNYNEVSYYYDDYDRYDSYYYDGY